MRTILLLITILVVSLGVSSQIAGQEKSVDDLKAQQKGLENKHFIKYDKFDEYTVVTSNPYDLIGLTERLRDGLYADYGVRELLFGSGFVFTGSSLTANNAKYYLFFSARSEKPQFLQNARLTIIADGNRIRLMPSEQKITSERYYGETLAYQIDSASLKSLVSAQVIEMKVGDYVQVLKKYHRQMIADTLQLGDVAVMPKEKKK